MYIRVSVHAKAKNESLVQKSDTHFVCSVREPAEQNRANKRVLELLRTHYPDALRIHLVLGHHASTKIVSVE